jgi:SAM-dependent methyltransferase
VGNFKLYSEYYDLIYHNKQTKEESEYIHSLLEKNGLPGLRWLEFGAGSGRHGVHFQSMGVNWTGIERSAEMAKHGQKKGLNIKVADISQPFDENIKYDAVLALFHVMSYLTDNNSLNNTFKNASQNLKTGGLFLFDVWYSPAVYFQTPEERTKKVSNALIDVERKATPTIDWNRNTVNVHYDIKVTDKESQEETHFSEDHLMRHFSLPELKLISGYWDFEFIHAEEWLTGETPSQNTWGICCVLKKQK